MKTAAIIALAGAACTAQAQFGAAVSEDASNDNFLTETITVDPGYDGNGMLNGTWSLGDMFGITDRAAAGSALPFAIADDSLFGFPGDSQGIIDENDQGRFFGVVDTVNSNNSSGTGTAEWTFDISGGSGLVVNIDFAAMGDFENSNDNHLFEVDIDGGGFSTLFASSIDEDGMQTYTMADGMSYDLDDPMLINGNLLDNNFQTLSAAIGSGSTLTLRYTGGGDGGTEAFAFRNISIVPAPGALALLGLGGLTAIRRRR